MEKGWSEMVREVAERDYARPAMQKGGTFRIVVGDLKKKLRAERNFPSSHTNQICSALESDKFLGTGLELLGGKGKPRLVDTVYEFRVRQDAEAPKSAPPVRDSLMELAGILKGTIREGADAFVREIRKDKVTGP